MNNRQYNFIIWGGWYGSRNIGDRLLLITITDLLSSIFVNFHVSILTANPEKVSEYFKDHLNNSELIKPTHQITELLRALIQCDLLIFGGGAPFFNQTKQAFSMLFLSTILRIIRKPYYLWCITSYKISNPLIGHIYRIVLNHAAKITCRDQYTVSEFTRLGVKRDLKIVQDPAFSLQEFDHQSAKILFEKYVPNDDEHRFFALTPRTLRTKDSEAQTHYNVKQQCNIEHQKKTYLIATNWLIENGYTPLFIPMNTEPPDDDRIVSKQIMEMCSNPLKVFLIDELIIPRAAPALYSKCQGSLVSRVHGSVSSFLGECPPVMYSFETKHTGIMEAMKLHKYIFNSQLSPEEVIPLIEFVLEKNDEIRKELRSLNHEFFDKAKEPLHDILEILAKLN